MDLSFIEIHKSILGKNLKSLKSALPKNKKIMAIVKGNAYGHGFKEVTGILKDDPLVDWFGVFEFADALSLRKITQKPILVLCTTEYVLWKKAIKNNISITLSRYDQMISVGTFSQKNKLKIHLKLDTGLGRQGFVYTDMDSVLDLVSRFGIQIEGLYTHFSGTESKEYDTYTKKQFREFLDWKKAFSEKGYCPITHAGATSGVLRDSQFVCDMARFGLGIYGLWPSEETKLFSKKVVLKPVLCLKSSITEIKQLPKGASVSYDRGVILKKETKVAVIPVGYYDGLPRALSYKMHVLIRGQKARILGKVMMNMIVVDVTSISKAHVGDMVTLLGRDKDKIISIDDWSFWTSLLNYEIVTRLNPLTKRYIVPLQKTKK